MPKGTKMMIIGKGSSIRTILLISAVTALATAMVTGPGCDSEDSSPAYRAEKALFDARKLASELAFPTVNKDFLAITLTSYRQIVEEFSPGAADDKGLDLLVVTAQMELSELEFRASLFEDAKKDFLHAYDISGNVPAARANALWSAAFISRESGNSSEAFTLFSKFHEEFLTGEKILDTARLNRRYILTPVRIAEMCIATADSECAGKWLGEAEFIFRHIIRSNAQDDIKKEARYNLVSTWLLARKWTKAREMIREMRKLYGDQADIPSLLYLEARVELNGFGNQEEAIAVFGRIVSEHPESKEASSALLMEGNILASMGRDDEAAAAYSRVVEEYDTDGPEMVEAIWQLALLEERRGNWIEASLHYKTVYTNFPTTIQGMEAPLRIAAYYRKTGETDALEAAYDRAEEHYIQLSTTLHSETVSIIAEEYYVRTLIDREDWEAAARKLLTLPDMYPQYHSFKGNCLMAASIYENKLGDPERAAEILQACTAKYPGTPVSEEAQKQIDRIRK